MKLAVVVPCYNEEDVLPSSHQTLVSLLIKLCDKGLIHKNSHILYVDDGSIDNTWALIEGFCSNSTPAKGLKLSRNVGHQNALLAGLEAAEGEAIVSIDADLQDDPNAIEDMLLEFNTGSDIVYGIRKDRSRDTLFKRISARYFYKFMAALGATKGHNHADFRLMSRRAIDALSNFEEINLYLRGIVPLIGFRHSYVEYERQERQAGTTKYSLAKMLSLGLEGITSFSIKPLRIITAIGLCISLASVFLTIWALYVKFHNSNAVPGWASTVLPIYFIGGVQLFSIGVIGEYVGKIYQEVKARPRYIIEKKI